MIAAHTGVSVGTVKSRISRARDTLERLLLEGDTRQRPTTATLESALRATAEEATEADAR